MFSDEKPEMLAIKALGDCRQEVDDLMVRKIAFRRLKYSGVNPLLP